MNDNYANESEFLLAKAKEILFASKRANGDCSLMRGGACPLLTSLLASKEKSIAVGDYR